MKKKKKHRIVLNNEKISLIKPKEILEYNNASILLMKFKDLLCLLVFFISISYFLNHHHVFTSENKTLEDHTSEFFSPIGRNRRAEKIRLQNIKMEEESRKWVLHLGIDWFAMFLTSSFILSLIINLIAMIVLVPLFTIILHRQKQNMNQHPNKKPNSRSKSTSTITSINLPIVQASFSNRKAKIPIISKFIRKIFSKPLLSNKKNHHRPIKLEKILICHH